MQCPRTPRLPSDSNDQWNVTKPFEIDADGALTQTGSHMIAMHIDMMSANMPDHSLFLQLPCYCSVFERMENPPGMPLPNRSYTDNGDIGSVTQKPKSWQSVSPNAQPAQLPRIP